MQGDNIVQGRLKLFYENLLTSNGCLGSSPSGATRKEKYKISFLFVSLLVRMKSEKELEDILRQFGYEVVNRMPHFYTNRFEEMAKNNYGFTQLPIPPLLNIIHCSPYDDTYSYPAPFTTINNKKEGTGSCRIGLFKTCWTRRDEEEIFPFYEDCWIPITSELRKKYTGRFITFYGNDLNISDKQIYLMDGHVVIEYRRIKGNELIVFNNSYYCFTENHLLQLKKIKNIEKSKGINKILEYYAKGNG